VPAHTYSGGAAIVCSFPGKHFVVCHLRPALQTSGYIPLTQNGVLKLPILLFELKGSHKLQNRVNKEAAA
jgi:hypothetical protein